MVSVYRGRTATVRVLSPCGYGTQILRPHHMYGCRVVTVYRHHANNVPTVAVWPRYTDTVPTWYRYHGHTATVHNMVARCPCTMSTRQLYIPCGHSVHVPWPHGDHTYCLGTDTRYTNIVPTQCLWSPCGHSKRTPCPHGVYRRRVATVHRYRAHTTCMVGVWPQYTNTVPTVAVWPRYMDTVLTQYRYRGHTATVHIVWAWTPCPHGVYHHRVATVHRYRAQTTHGCCVATVYQHRANTVPTVAVRPPYTDTVPTWYRHRGHTATIHNGVARWPCTVSTRQLYISCGHGVHVPWPHGNRLYCLGTISAYRSHTVTVHTVWVQYLCGYGSVYHSHTATVHTPYTVATRRQCHAMATQQLCGQR